MPDMTCCTVCAQAIWDYNTGQRDAYAVWLDSGLTLRLLRDQLLLHGHRQEPLVAALTVELRQAGL